MYCTFTPVKKLAFFLSESSQLAHSFDVNVAVRHKYNEINNKLDVTITVY